MKPPRWRLEPAVESALFLVCFVAFVQQEIFSWIVWLVVELLLVLYWTILETPTPRPRGLSALVFGAQHIVLAGSSGALIWWLGVHR